MCALMGYPFFSPLPITDVWLHTCSIHEWLPSAANHKGRLDQMEALTDRHVDHVHRTGTAFFLPPLPLMIRAEEIHSGVQSIDVYPNHRQVALVRDQS